MKNEYLVDGFLNCLSALQQNSMDQLAAINSLFVSHYFQIFTASLIDPFVIKIRESSDK